MNKDLTSSLFHYQKISDAAELDNKERDKIAVYEYSVKEKISRLKERTYD